MFKSILQNVQILAQKYKNSSFASMPQTVSWKFVFERRRFRQFLSSLAEWCTAYRGKGGRRWAAAVKLQATATISPPPIFFPLVSYGGAHHSAANAVSERNLQRKITKTRQQMQQKELAKLK